MNPRLYLIIYRKDRLDEIKDFFIKNNISIYSYLSVKSKAVSRMLHLLGLGDMDEEMLYAISKKENLELAYGDKDFPKDLISNIIPLKLSRLCGLSNEIDFIENGEEMQKVIFIIVNKGQSNQVVSIANKHGARGATIINARGAGIFLEQKFDMEIEPEKEIVLIATNTKTEVSIAKALADELGFDKPNSGILFTIPIDEAFGIIKKK